CKEGEAMPPAARVGDMHVCPLVTGLVPHVGGPILPPGWPQVMIGGPFAARVADMATCVGPPDAIAMGSPTVLVGNMLAARMADPTVHGGMVVLGLPTVMIGEAGGAGAPGAGGMPVTVVRRGNTFIIVDPNAHMLYMVGVQEFSGTGASQAYVDAATAEI